MGFSMSGYGGFGYDTSHVSAGETHSKLYQLAKIGNIKGVTNLVEKIQDPRERAKNVNHARRWTEVDYKASGFAKEYEWFDLTPVSIAAMFGHTDVLMYLLQKHADPTLIGCYGEDAYATTKDSAKSCLDKMTPYVMKLRNQTSSPPFYWLIPFQGETAEEKAKEVYLSFKRAKYNVTLVEEALKFWDRASYAHAGSTRVTFFNKPKDGLEEALQALKMPVLGDDPNDADEVALIARTFMRHKEYFAKNERKNEKQRNGPKKNRYRKPCRSTKDSDHKPFRPAKKPRHGPKRLRN